MSALRSALEEWVNEDLDGLAIDQLADDLVELEQVAGLIEAERLRRLDSFSRRSGPLRLGFPSLTAFLKGRCRMAGGRAHRLVCESRLVTEARDTFRAWTDGRLSTDQTRALLDLAGASPGHYAGAETRLIEIVEELGVADTRRALAYWRQSVDGPGTMLEEREQQGFRGISASRSLNGMLRVDGWMTPLAGEALITALDALMHPPAPGDDRTPRQRRHDALEDLARDFLDHCGAPQVGGERPHIDILCDLPALAGIAGGLHETRSGQLLTVDELRELACDSSVCRIVIGSNSEIIDVGRRTRVIPAALRRAVVARDRTCTWPECDRGPRWCDVHHIVHWADGGETMPANLRLLCRFHHTMTHRLDDTGRDPPGGRFP